MGRKCFLILDRTLASTVFEKHADSLNSAGLRWRILTHVFGAKPTRDLMKSAPPNPPPTDNRAHASAMTAAFETHIPDLVSFAESPIDQHPWERPANPVHVQQPYGMKLRPAVEVDLVALINRFVGHVSINATLGREFMEVHSSVLEEMTAMDHGWKYLVTGFARWLPLPVVSRAHLARRRLLYALDSYNAALDAEAKGEMLTEPWGDLDDVSRLVRNRRAFWRAHSIFSDVSEPVELAFIWE